MASSLMYRQSMFIRGRFPGRFGEGRGAHCGCLGFARHDNSVTTATREPGKTPTRRQHCHPDRSGGSCCFSSPVMGPCATKGKSVARFHSLWVGFAGEVLGTTREGRHGRADSFPTSRQKRARYGAPTVVAGWEFNGCSFHDNSVSLPRKGWRRPLGALRMPRLRSA
jgi:hypothetical protein